MKQFLILAVLCLPAPLLAKITSATLFPSHAQLVWEQSLDLQQGDGRIELPDFPTSLQDESLYLEFQGLSGIKIQQVRVRQIEHADSVVALTRQLREELREVKNRIGIQEDRIRSWSQQLRIMEEITVKPGDVELSELTSLASLVMENTQSALTRIREIRQAMADDMAEQDRIERELAKTQQNARATKTISVFYQAGQGGDATLRIRYQTRSASWRSQYNARLETTDNGMKGMLVLEHLALVRQGTGVDWNGVKLSLSTANAMAGTDIPPLYPWLVTAGEQLTYRSKSIAVAAFDTVQPETLAQTAGVASVENSGVFTQHYQVDGPVSLVSGDEEQRVTVAEHEITASIETRFFPAMSNQGFIHASGPYEGEVTLPSGPVTLYRDGQSVGRDHLDRLPAGNQIDLGFGINDRVVVDVINEENRKGEQGVFRGEKYARRLYRYEITSHHNRRLAIRVFDRLPVSRQDDLAVKELDITEPVTRDAKDLKGVLSWARTLDPGKMITLKFGFELRVPEQSELPSEFQ